MFTILRRSDLLPLWFEDLVRHERQEFNLSSDFLSVTVQGPRRHEPGSATL